MLDKFNTETSRRWLLLGIWIFLSSLLFARPLLSLLQLSLSDNNSSHILLIPFFALSLLFIERHYIFRKLSSDSVLGSLTLILAFGLITGSQLVKSMTSDLRLTSSILALLLFWVAGFAFFFGRSAVKAGYFPILFLFLTVPLPNLLLQRIIYLLQAGSADITGALFDLLGVPALREGFVFHLAHVNIEVASECSGIRSSIALLILALPVVHFGLRRFWKKVVFLACALLMMIIKNGIRIVALTLLSTYVNRSFLFGRLHHEGGIFFFLVGLLILLPIYLLLQERQPGTQAVKATTSTKPA
jgi:exosortase